MVVKTISNEEKNLAVLSHILSIFAGFLGPLIIYLVVDEKKKFAKENAKNALNFQISVAIYLIASIILFIILIGFLFFFLIILLDIIFIIIASIKASDGINYSYPLTIPFLK